MGSLTSPSVLVLDRLGEEPFKKTLDDVGQCYERSSIRWLNFDLGPCRALCLYC